MQNTPNAELPLAPHVLEDHRQADSKLNIIVVSGRSGSGKTSVLNILEDFGYYAIDNLPLSLVPDAAEKLTTDGDIYQVAFGVDVRTPHADLSQFPAIHAGLIERYGEAHVTVLYVTAQESVLVARFDANRRVHPLMAKINHSANNLPAAIKQEIQLLEPIASRADIKIDSSLLNIHELKERVREHVGLDNKVTVNLLSFGFKYGIPIDADFVFDVRILPNPHWEPSLREKTGQDDEVIAFFSNYSQVAEMEQAIYQFLARWLPDFLHNNRHTITVAIGCTGGKHRSVYITEQLSVRLAQSLPAGMTVMGRHREKSAWSK